MRVPAALVLSAISVLPTLPAKAEVKLIVAQDANPGPGTLYPTINVCNETPAPFRVEGWKFRTLDSSSYTTWLPGLTRDGGSGPVEYTQPVPGLEAIMQSGKCRTAPTDYTGIQAAGKDISLRDPQALIKVGTCAEPVDVQEAPSLRCAELSSAAAGSYYQADKCLADIPAANALGGFLASFADRTQIQAAIPSQPVFVSAMDMKWDPRWLGGPQYMMSLAMAQELFHVDMRALAAMAGKETRFGFVEPGKDSLGSLSERHAYTLDNDGTFGPWELEYGTFITTMQSYPRFFPAFGPCISRYPDATSANPCFGGGSDSAAAFYMRTPGLVPTRIGINSPQLASATVSVTLTLLSLYDNLANATDLHFNQALAARKDPRLALAAIFAGYNLGRFTDFAAPFKDPAIVSNPSASSLFPTGNAGYRPDIFKMLDAAAKADSASIACGGSNPVYDTSLSFSEVQRFFFGGSVTPGTPTAQGDGGLLLHFKMTGAERQALLDELQCAFNKLKGKAPSTVGRDAVSYRYDWLTLLRVAKGLLPARVRPLPLSHDFNYVLDNYSKGAFTAGGQAKDSKYPLLRLLAPVQNQVFPPDVAGFQVRFSGTDGSGIVKAEWTLDRDWQEWSPAESEGEALYAFRVPCGLKGYPKAGEKGTLWVRMKDKCGNATVQALDFTAHATALCGDPTASPRVRGGGKVSATSAKGFRAELRAGTVVFVPAAGNSGSRAGADSRGKSVVPRAPSK